MAGFGPEHNNEPGQGLSSASQGLDVVPDPVPLEMPSMRSALGAAAQVAKIIDLLGPQKAERFLSKLRDRSAARPETEKSQLLKPRSVSGHPDLLPHQARVMNRMQIAVAQAYQNAGCTQRTQPVIESVETIDQAKRTQGFDGAGLAPTDAQRHKFTVGNSSALISDAKSLVSDLKNKQTESSGSDVTLTQTEITKLLEKLYQLADFDLALRVDHTLGLARFVAQHQDKLPIPFHTYTIGEVFRGERAQKGRQRSFWQADCDIIGVAGTFADAQIIAAIYEGIRSAAPEEKFNIKINHRKIINGFLERLEVPRERHAAVFRTMDKLDKEGADAVMSSLTRGFEDDDIDYLDPNAPGLSPKDAKILVDFLEPVFCKTLTPSKLLEVVAPLEKENELIAQGIKELREICAFLSPLNVDENYIRIDFSIVRGLDYYSGMVFEVELDLDDPRYTFDQRESLKSLGSIGGGGRYDHLTGAYMKEAKPGVGGSIGLTRLLAALEDLGKVPQDISYAEAVIVTFPGADIMKVAGLLVDLRKAGLSVSIHPDALDFEKPIKIDKQRRYGKSLNALFTIDCGEDETSGDEITIKVFNNSTQEKASFENVEEAVKYMKAYTASL